MLLREIPVLWRKRAVDRRAAWAATVFFLSSYIACLAGRNTYETLNEPETISGNRFVNIKVHSVIGIGGISSPQIADKPSLMVTCLKREFVINAADKGWKKRSVPCFSDHFTAIGKDFLSVQMREKLADR